MLPSELQNMLQSLVGKRYIANHEYFSSFDGRLPIYDTVIAATCDNQYQGIDIKIVGTAHILTATVPGNIHIEKIIGIYNHIILLYEDENGFIDSIPCKGSSDYSAYNDKDIVLEYLDTEYRKLWSQNKHDRDFYSKVVKYAEGHGWHVDLKDTVDVTNSV